MSHQEHPERTPVYGSLMIVAAMLAAVAITRWSEPTAPIRVVVLVAVLLSAAVGVFLTLRDLPPR
jgi:UDP-N-acetylmuramyl pentapeptide phosphotransferase/UDP-N-acetylglucosamine-1-phosphate transferase